MAKAADTGKKSGAENKKPVSSGTTAAKPAGKNTGGTKTATKTAPKTAPAAQQSPALHGDPIRFRGVKAFVCLALALFSLIGCFTREGLFIRFFRTFIQGLVGKGFFFLPVLLFYCAVMLLYVKDRPLGGRITCTLLLSVTAGALFHLFGSTVNLPWNWYLAGHLYETGSLSGASGSGGAVSGLLAMCFRSLFNRVGAGIVLILGTLFLLFSAVDVTISAIMEKSRERAKVKAEEWKLLREQEQQRAEERRIAARQELEARARAEAAEKELFQKTQPMTAAKPKKNRMIDIPLDGEAEAPAPEAPAAQPVKPAEPKKPAEVPKPWYTPPVKRSKAAQAAQVAQVEEKPREPEKTPTEVKRDWLAEILTKDRLDSPNPAENQNRARNKVVDTAIHPAEENPAQSEEEPSGRWFRRENPEERSLEALAEKPVTVQSEKPAEKSMEKPIEKPAAPPAVTPAAEPAPIRTEAVMTARMPEAPLPEPVKPAPAPTPSTAVKPTVSADALAEATAVLTDEKNARAVEKAETVKMKAEMVASIEENLSSEGQNLPVKYSFPPINLLTAGSGGDNGQGREEMAVNGRRLSATIKSFGIPAEICDVTRGPTVTRYEVELEQGVKLNRLTNLSDDIALALGVSGVRIAPVPDKISIVGIEVPNKKTTTVYLRDVIDTSAFREKKSSLTFAIGRDIAGQPIVGDISKLTHLLIAGTTGSGKSVCMNSLILSLLYNASPEDVRLIMVDPKMIELGIYNGIPHLLIPVVTDPKKAAGALQWAVMEMLKRYTLIADSGARDLDSYNKIMERTEGGQKLPKIVILIDELADLMMAAAKDVEESICRIAQMGRAGGIHLVIATQRPSADVITGLMKANIPARIAFAVDSALNSRIILDTSGAEKLVGKGDMLYAPTGSGKPLRVQGTFVTDDEREEVINYVKEQGLANYDRQIQDEIERSTDKDKKKDAAAEEDSDGLEDDLDELFDDAVGVVLDSGQASVSMLQRRLKLGYSRAARIVDQMEERGVVGPFEGSKPRPVLITREQWNVMKGLESPPLNAPLNDEEDEGVPEEIL